MVPILNRFALLLLPLSAVVTWLSDRVLRLTGMRSKADTNVGPGLSAQGS